MRSPRVGRLTQDIQALRARLAELKRQAAAHGRAIEALRARDAALLSLIERASDYAIFTLDPEGRVLTWNTGARRLLGYATDEVVGRHCSRFYPAEDLARGEPERALKAAAAEGRFERSGWRVRKDGARFRAHVVMTAIRDSSGKLRGFSTVTLAVTERERRRIVNAAPAGGRPARDVGHEMRNRLGVIANAVYYLKMLLPEHEKAREYLQVLDHEVGILKQIVATLSAPGDFDPSFDPAGRAGHGLRPETRRVVSARS